MTFIGTPPADVEYHCHTSLSCFWLPYQCKSNIHCAFRCLALSQALSEIPGLLLLNVPQACNFVCVAALSRRRAGRQRFHTDSFCWSGGSCKYSSDSLTEFTKFIFMYSIRCSKCFLSSWNKKNNSSTLKCFTRAQFMGSTTKTVSQNRFPWSLEV